MIDFNGVKFHPSDSVLADLTAALVHHKVTGMNKAQPIALGDQVIEMRPAELLACLEQVQLARLPDSGMVVAFGADGQS